MCQHIVTQKIIQIIKFEKRYTDVYHKVIKYLNTNKADLSCLKINYMYEAYIHIYLRTRAHTHTLKEKREK